LDFLGSCDLDLDPMTFIYELDPYCLGLYPICNYELPTSRLSKVIVYSFYIHKPTDRQTDRQTEFTEIIKHAVLNAMTISR